MMPNKEELRKQFSKEPRKYYEVSLFKEQGFERLRCSLCGKYFWSADPSRKLCGDPSHEPYSFIRQAPRSVDYAEFWRSFSRFFKKEGHAIIRSYPVVSRWRQDLYYTIAGIQDFQRIEHGKMSFEYPANPLLVPQMCMRFNDIANVGINGRHLTAFMMANQTAFNYPKEGYWRDRTIELNYKVLTELLGVKKEAITYIEDVWAMGDFSEFGPSIEAFSNGLELVNNVFTQFGYTDGKIRELDGKVVDVGWGFERDLWFKAGTQTVYDAVFKRQLEYIHKSAGIKQDIGLYSKIAGEFSAIDLTETVDAAGVEARILQKVGIDTKQYSTEIKPMQASYATADHARTLLFAINDGALPSNVGGGYNLRILLRRLFGFSREYGIDIDILKLMEIHADELSDVYPNLNDGIETAKAVIEMEKRRYESTKSAAARIVDTIIEKNEALTAERMRVLYESNGITPEFIESLAKEKHARIDVPQEAYTRLLKSDFVEKAKQQKELGIDTSGLRATEKLYYNGAYEASAKVLRSSGNLLILDRTPFYPEGGGQETDRGTINGIGVADVQMANGIIVHALVKRASFKKGSVVHCNVDRERRMSLMAHHTATHLVSAACRSVLGKHAWQEGARKAVDKAHIDIAHYDRLSEEQVQAIEDKANSYITHGIRVSVQELPRSVAERKFGFAIYQGHGAPASRLRIVQVHDTDGNLIDAEACGGLHLAGRESGIGLIKIIGTYHIHDGINRIEFVAGSAAVNRINALDASIDGLAKTAGVDRSKLSEGLQARLNELQGYKEKLEKSEGELLEYIVAGLLAESNSNESVKQLEHDRKALRQIATQFVEARPGSLLALYNKNGEVVCIAGSGSHASALDFVMGYAKKAGKEFRGGGTGRIAEGRLV
jgi:alanyl-tRNA synthetase